MSKKGNKVIPLHDMVDGIIKEATQRVSDPDHAPVELEDDKPEGITSEGVDLDYAEKVAGAAMYAAEHMGDSARAEKTREYLRTKLAEHGTADTLLPQKKAKGKSQSQDMGGTQTIPVNPPTTEKGTKLQEMKTQFKAPVKLSEADRSILKKAILEKLGSGVDNPPNMGGGPVQSPPGTFKTGDEPQKAPAGGGHQHVASNEAAINMTKGEAKKQTAYPDLNKLLDKHRLNRSTDPVLHNNLRNTSKAGVKIAGKRKEQLSKIAAGGCTCDGNGSCPYCRLNILSGGRVATGADQPAS